MKNLIHVKISGLNLSRLVNKLVLNNVLVSDLVTKKKFIKFSILESDLKVLDKICKQEHKFYVITGNSGIKDFFMKLPYFLGTILALVIIYVYLFSISQFVYNVNIKCESEKPYDLTKVTNVLKQNGIVSGMRKKSYSISDIQNLLLINIDDIEGCTVKLNGGELNITIYPAVTKYEIQTGDLISKYDAIIISAEAYVGNLKVKAGDLVRAGDVLIEDNNGAVGKIEAKVYFTGTKIYNENQQEIIYTGNYFIKKDYLICNKFLIKSKNICPFSMFLVKKCGFYVTQNFFLPIYCEEEIYYEIEIKDKVVPFEENEEEIKQETYNEALSKIPTGSELGSVTYSVVKEGNFTRVDCFIETIINLV